MTEIPDTDPLPAESCARRRPGAIYMLPVIVLLAVGVLVGCSQEKKDTIEEVDPGEFPTMRTLNVSTLVSDSGYTRYHITAPSWLMFDEAKEPYWSFPEGLDMERYDDNREVEATFRSDSAVYFNAKRLWRFDGNVRMRNTGGDRFAVEQLFWDQQNGKVYSDSFIQIERIDRTIEGVGFESNEQMTEYSILDVQAILPTPERRDSTARRTSQLHSADSARSDSASAPVTSPASRQQNTGEP